MVGKTAMSAKDSAADYSRPTAHTRMATRPVVAFRLSSHKKDALLSLLSSIFCRWILKTKNSTPLLVCCTWEVAWMSKTYSTSVVGRVYTSARIFAVVSTNRFKEIKKYLWFDSTATHAEILQTNKFCIISWLLVRFVENSQFSHWRSIISFSRVKLIVDLHSLC